MGSYCGQTSLGLDRLNELNIFCRVPSPLPVGPLTGSRKPCLNPQTMEAFFPRTSHGTTLNEGPFKIYYDKLEKKHIDEMSVCFLIFTNKLTSVLRDTLKFEVYLIVYSSRNKVICFKLTFIKCLNGSKKSLYYIP